jgi:hypothetical protein
MADLRLRVPHDIGSGVDVKRARLTAQPAGRSVDGVRLINAGSVGMPYGRPGACWLLLGPDVRLTRTEYDLEHAAELVRKTLYPQTEEFASRHVLKPYSEEEAIRVFEKVPPTGQTSER